MVGEIQTWEAFDPPQAGNSCKQQIVTTFALNINLVIKDDKGSFVELINLSILGRGDGSNKLISLIHVHKPEQQQNKVDGPTLKLTTSPLGSQAPKDDD